MGETLIFKKSLSRFWLDFQSRGPPKRSIFETKKPGSPGLVWACFRLWPGLVAFGLSWTPLGLPWASLGAPFELPWPPFGLPLASLWPPLTSPWPPLVSLSPSLAPLSVSWHVFSLFLWFFLACLLFLLWVYGKECLPQQAEFQKKKRGGGASPAGRLQ